jgi:hypothetical protein
LDYYYCLLFQDKFMRLLILCLFLFQNHDLDSDNAIKVDDVKSTVQKTSINTPDGTKWGYYYFLILSDKKVQSELQLSPSQLSRLSKLTEDFIASRKLPKPVETNAKGDAKNNSQPPIKKESPMKLIGQFSTQAVEILSEDQKHRLAQIIFQLRKIEIFSYPDIAKDFNLSAEQQNEIESIRSWILEEAKKLHGEYIVKKKDSKEFQKQTQKLLEEGQNRLIKSFSDEQLKKLEVMEGKKIPFNRNDLNFTLRQTNTTDKAPEP